jgi:hypothetical protein
MELNPPKYKQGDRIGKLTVIEVMEYGKRHIAQARQWYKVECDCGNVEETNQQNLNKKKQCVECSQMVKGIHVSLAKKPKPNIPDFLRMKL